MPLSINDYEKEFLLDMVGGAALPTDTIDDLRYKFYKGVYDGTIVIGGGGGGAAATEPMPAVGQYALPWLISSAGNPTVAGLQGGTVPLTPILVSGAMTINALVSRIMTLQAGVNAKMLLYGANANRQPGALVVASAGFSCAAAGIQEIAIAATPLTAGMYYGAILTDAGTTVAFLGGRATVGLDVTDSNGFLGSAMVFKGNCGTYAAPAANVTLAAMGDNDVVPTVALKRSA